MQYTIIGRLCGYICPNVEESIHDAEVRLYRPAGEGREIVAAATARSKRTARMIDDEAVDAKGDRLLATATTDEDGTFEVTLTDDDDYQGGPVEIDVRLETVPGETSEDAESVQVSITTVQPEWRKGENSAVFHWEHCFTDTFWCRVRAQFGAYVICGVAMDCEDEETRAGLTVRARDADIVQHEVLGSATTDADGRFRIYYSRDDFERVPMPFFPIELFGGPDLYYEVDDTDGTLIYAEEPSRGRKSDRDDAGPCEHVRLCVDLPPKPDDPDEPTTWPEPMFTHVGRYDIASEIDANGYAIQGSERLAFTGTLPLIGVMPPGGSPTATEYRFQVEDLDTGAVTTLDSSAIRSTRIGTLQYWDETSPGTWELEHEGYWLENASATNNVEADGSGWIEVPREDDLGAVGTPGSGAFARDSNLLVRFNSHVVLQEAFDLTTPDVHEAGESLDSSEKSTEHAFKITFESREVGAPGTVRTDTLSRIVISNTDYTQRRHPSWVADEKTLPGVAMLDIQEFLDAGDGCIRLDDTLTAAVTAYNPHINDVTVYFEGPGSLPATATPAPSGGEVATTIPFNISGLEPCAYVLWLEVSYDLTGGYGRIDDSHDHIAFCVSDASP